jgi:hypothetical protein
LTARVTPRTSRAVVGLDLLIRYSSFRFAPISAWISLAAHALVKPCEATLVNPCEATPLGSARMHARVVRIKPV